MQPSGDVGRRPWFGSFWSVVSPLQSVDSRPVQADVECGYGLDDLVHLPTMVATWLYPLGQYAFSPDDALLPLGVLLIIVALMLGIRKKRRRIAQRGTAREQLERMNQETAVRGDLEQLMVEIEQLAKRLGAQLDAKTLALEKLLHEADQVIEKLERGAGPTEPPADPQTIRIYRLADEGRSPMEIAQELDEHVGKVELILALRKAR